jgi:isocitrate dehydrogenase kinase/phosphatase
MDRPGIIINGGQICKSYFGGLRSFSCKKLKANIDLNKFSNIKQINIGVSDKKEKARLDEKYFGSSVTSLFYKASMTGL